MTALVLWLALVAVLTVVWAHRRAAAEDRVRDQYTDEVWQQGRSKIRKIRIP